MGKRRRIRKLNKRFVKFMRTTTKQSLARKYPNTFV